ncbi:FG-GAP repeat domain-containing protein [Chitinophaga japonensis]|uniref:VCBS repeat protein n=1 Tax=Chitinophaga japonensis TaxID=104662 RepID=A0A562TDK3_CHIJA|nr:VCBS repeat-containing protein [Chitinophaga japonensis]TWI91641.1 VCBS repeat protein [Chitinophaga japonensis]
MQLPDRTRLFTPYCYLLLLLAAAACNEDLARINRVKEGSLLARRYCASCHAFPGPALLDKTTWEEDVLPVMGARLGIKNYHGSYYRAPVLADTPGAVANLIAPGDWDRIVAYYTTVAPWRPLPQRRSQPVSSQAMALFTIREPAWQRQAPAPLTSFVCIDTLRRDIWMANAQDSFLYRYNSRLQPVQRWRTASVVADVALPAAASGSRGYITCLGTLYPSDALRGSIQVLEQQDTLELLPELLRDRLPRPVQSLPADLNGDGRTDLLVCGFGFNRGYLAWLELDTAGRKAIQEHLLLPQPGAIKAFIHDSNEDGRPDIWVLMGQGDEGIWYLENAGEGRFNPRRVLQFPPAYGSSSFALQDVDHDGREDIIYTCGDNADDSRVLKAYHGVYIYRNLGNQRFEQAYFYPVNGCYKAIARDFDLDGDEDLLTISFFADYGNQPQEALLYFMNQGGFNFTVHTLPAAKLGHWICMDAADLDGDGDTDVVLGNFSQAPVNFPGLGTHWRNAPPFIVLENNTHRFRKKP